MNLNHITVKSEDEARMDTRRQTLSARPPAKILGVLARLLGALACLALALFGVFGFLEAFEPGNGLVWKVGYGALACGFLVGAVVLLRGSPGNAGSPDCAKSEVNS
jgi:hypothetical protein